MKYRLEGLDCAQCAADIEHRLRKEPGMENASVSFANLTLALDPAYRDRAERIIGEIEPAVTIVNESGPGAAMKQAADGKPRPKFRRTAIRIGISAALLAVGMIWNDALHDTPYAAAEWLVLLPAYLLAGWPVVTAAVRNIVHGRVMDEMFLMTVATLGAFAIHELPEAVAVMLFYAVGEYFQDRAVDRSRRSIASLMDLRPDYARIIEDGGTRTVAPEAVEVGAEIEVLPGERVPLDGNVTDGASAVNTAALTGESVPRTVHPGDEVLAGFTNEHGRLRVRVTKEFGSSSVAKILELVENAAARKSPTERFITKFAAVYTPIVVFSAAAVALIPPLVFPGASLAEWVYRALVLLVISCPCALVVSIPLGYFGGIGGASRNNILVKGANYIDELAKLKTVVFDKTGTLTKGVFRVVDVVPRNGCSKEKLLEFAAHAEAQSTHPVARSIREAYRGRYEPARLEAFEEIRGFGVKVVTDSRVIHAGNDRFLHREKIPHTDCNVRGTVVYVAVDGSFAGYIVISDEVKEHAKDTVRELKSLGVGRVLMLTGDNDHIAEGVAEELGLDGYFANLLPEDKVAKIEELKLAAGAGERIAFVGDGMNDAPVLMRSDIGIAMGALGSDAAIEAADVVLMDDHLAKVPLAVRISRFTRKVVVQNIVLALAIKLAFIGLGLLGAADMWEAVIGDVGVSLLAVLNSIRTLKFAEPAAEPVPVAAV